MRGIRFSRKAAVVAFLILLSVPSAFASAGITLSGGVTLGHSGDMSRIDVPTSSCELSFRANDFYSHSFFNLTGLSSGIGENWIGAVIPSIGFELFPDSYSKFLLNPLVIAGIGPYLYKQKAAFVMDCAIGAELYLNGFAVQIMNHFDYMTGFYYFSYRLMVGVGFAVY